MTGRSALAGPHRSLAELQDALFLDLGDVPGKMFRFWVLLVLSAIIATAGVLADSTATVIGAIIIAPLGLPIMGTGLAVVTSDGRRMWTSAALAAGGASVVVLLGAALAWAAPKLQAITANGQVTSRTAPSIIDLIAAIATGFAGSYGLARRDISDIMPGVAAQTAREQASLNQASAAARPWAAGYGYKLLDVRFEGPDLEVAIEGTGPPPPGQGLLIRLRGRVPAGTPVGDDAQERPAAGLRARARQLRERQVVEQVQAQRVDGQDVHREVDARDPAGA